MKVLAPALRIYCVLLVLALVWIFFWVGSRGICS
jgi:hypothetical protein